MIKNLISSCACQSKQTIKREGAGGTRVERLLEAKGSSLVSPHILSLPKNWPLPTIDTFDETNKGIGKWLWLNW